MRMATLRGMAAGSLIGLAVGAGMMAMPQSKQMKSMVNRGRTILKRQLEGMCNR